MSPKIGQDGSRWLQVGSKLAHVGPRWGDFGAMLAYVGASWGHLKIAWNHLKIAWKLFWKILILYCFLQCFWAPTEIQPVLAYEREARKNTRMREAIACYLCHHASEHMFTWVLERTSARFARSGCSVLEHLGSISGHLGGILEHLGSNLGSFWEHFGSLCWPMLRYVGLS